MKHILFLDTETSGVDPVKNEVIEIGAILYTNGVQVSQFHAHLATSGKKEISLGALRVNKRTMATDNYEETRSQVVQNFVDYLLSLPNDRQNPVTIGAHNTAFDVNFLKQMLSLEGFTGWGDLFSYSVIDTSTIGNFLRDAGVLSFDRMSLGALAKTLNIKVDDSKTHGAFYDAQLCAECYFKMKTLLNDNFTASRSSFANIKLNNT